MSKFKSSKISESVRVRIRRQKLVEKIVRLQHMTPGEVTSSQICEFVDTHGFLTEQELQIMLLKLERQGAAV